MNGSRNSRMDEEELRLRDIPEIVEPVSALVGRAVGGDWKGIEGDGLFSERCFAADFERVVREYGVQLVIPPEQSLLDSYVFPRKGDPNCTAIDVDMWSVEEGQSDLTLQLEVWRKPDGIAAYITDLHVL